MGLLLEILLELIVEGSIELSSNKKVPKIIRYPLIVLIVLFFVSIILGLFIIGIIIIKDNIVIGILMIALSIVFLGCSIKKIRNYYKY